MRGLKALGVAESDIWVYDVTRGSHRGQMPGRLVDKVRALYPGVQFHAYANDCTSPAVTTLGYSSTDFIHFNTPTPHDLPICTALTLPCRREPWVSTS